MDFCHVDEPYKSFNCLRLAGTVFSYFENYPRELVVDDSMKSFHFSMPSFKLDIGTHPVLPGTRS